MTIALLLAAVCAFTPNAHSGFYQWAAARPAEALHSTIDKLHELHAGLVRLYVGSRYDYQHPVLAPDRARLLPADVLRQAAFRAILEDPCIPTVVLSVYPARDYGAGPDDINLHRPWSEVEAAAETSQLLAMADAIYQMIGDQDKTVIIANSEADARLVEIANYTGSLPLAIDNVTKWQRTRYQAIARARLRHPQAKLRLLNAFEISLVNLSIEPVNRQYKTSPSAGTNALRAIVPHVPFDLLSYSSYETINSPYQTGAVNTNPAEIKIRLNRDIRILRSATSKPIMIGEIGFSRADFDQLPTGGVTPRLSAALEALEQIKPAYVVLWQAYDGLRADGAPDGFGLLEPASNALAVIRRFLVNFALPNSYPQTEARPRPSAQKATVTQKNVPGK